MTWEPMHRAPQVQEENYDYCCHRAGILERKRLMTFKDGIVGYSDEEGVFLDLDARIK